MPAQPPVDLHLLDDFSSDFYDKLFALYPEWKSLASRINDSTSFQVFVPSPGDPSSHLWISTENEEVTVGFGTWHSHYGWSDVDSTISNQEAFDLITSILKEESAIQAFYRNDEWRGSVIVSYADGFFDDLDDWRAAGATRTRRRSWLGSLNLEQALPPL